MEPGGRGAPHDPAGREGQEAVESLSSRATSGAVLLLLRGLAARLAGAGGTLVVARLLVPHQFGLLAFGLTLVALANFLVDSGVGASLIRSDAEPQPHVLQAVVGFQLAATVALIALVSALTVPFGTVMLVTATMALDLLFSAPRVPAGIILERRLDYRSLATAEIGDALTYNAVAIGLVVLGAGVWGVAIAAAVQSIPGTLFVLLKHPDGRVTPSIDLPALGPIFKFGVQFQAISLVELVRDEIAAVAVGALASFSILGIITLAEQLMQVVSLLFESLWRVSFPAMAELQRAGGDSDAAITRVSRLCMLITALLVCGLAAGAPGSLTVLLGTRWKGVLEVLPGMLAGLLIVGPISVACVGFLLAAGNARAVLRSAVAHTAATWATLPFLLAFGLRAVAVGAFVTCVIEALLLARATRRLSGRNPLVPLLPTLGVALVISAGAWWLATDATEGLPGSVAIAAGAVALLLTWYAVFERATLADMRGLAGRYAARFRDAGQASSGEDLPVL